MPYQRTDLMALILVCITDGEYIELINKGACNLSTEAKIFQISNRGVG